MPGIALVNLQRGSQYRHWHQTPSTLPMIEVFDSEAITDAAATIAQLDLVITVDTMVAHLAGALGAPVWLMLHFAADWRWLLDRCDSPWYPTTRLFRQKHPGNWETVIDECRRRAPTNQFLIVASRRGAQNSPCSTARSFA